jgi:hypothetical protein
MDRVLWLRLALIALEVQPVQPLELLFLLNVLLDSSVALVLSHRSLESQEKEEVCVQEALTAPLAPQQPFLAQGVSTARTLDSQTSQELAQQGTTALAQPLFPILLMESLATSAQQESTVHREP